MGNKYTQRRHKRKITIGNEYFTICTVSRELKWYLLLLDRNNLLCTLYEVKWNDFQVQNIKIL